MSKNLLINGEFNVAQRGTIFDSTTTPKNDNNAYLLDRWVLLSGANNNVAGVFQVTDAPRGSTTAQKAVVQTVNEKFGFLQIIENANCQNIIGDVASLSFQTKTGANAISNIRAAILSWNGRKDWIESNVVSTWNKEGTDPTLAAGWTYENIAFDIPLTERYTKFCIPNVFIDTADTKNVAVFIWVDDTNAAIGDELYLGRIQLEKGSTASDFESRFVQQELLFAKRYYQRMTTGGARYQRFGLVQAISPIVATGNILLETEMRTAPRFSTSGKIALSNARGNGNAPITEFTAVTPSPSILAANFHVASGLVAGDAAQFLADNDVNAYLEFDAEL